MKLSKPIRTTLAIIAWAHAATSAAQDVSEAVEAVTVYYGFRLIDPDSATMTDDAWIAVDGSTIREVGSGAPPGDATLQRVDMSGHYAVPGLIDAHAHITIGPLTVEIENGAPVIASHPREGFTQHHALVALGSGVTTVRNPAGEAQSNAMYEARRAAGDWLGPDALQAGETMDPLPIARGSVYPNTDAEWDAEILRQRSLGMDYIKLYTGLDETELATGIRIAHSHGMQTIAHLDQVSWTKAMHLGVDAITHALPTSADLLVEPARSTYLEHRGVPSAKFMYEWFELVDFDSRPMRELIDKLVETQTPVDLTLVVNELVYKYDALEDVFSPEQIALMVHPDMLELWHQQMQGSHFGWTDADYARAHAAMPRVLEFARTLHRAGVALMLGTDGTGGGPALQREMELHVEAGLDAWEVLALATTNNARLLGIAGRTGSLRANLEADIVFLRSDPTVNVSNIADVELVVSDGVPWRASELRARRTDLLGRSQAGVTSQSEQR